MTRKVALCVAQQAAHSTDTPIQSRQPLSGLDLHPRRERRESPTPPASINTHRTGSGTADGVTPPLPPTTAAKRGQQSKSESKKKRGCQEAELTRTG